MPSPSSELVNFALTALVDAFLEQQPPALAEDAFDAQEEASAFLLEQQPFAGAAVFTAFAEEASLAQEAFASEGETLMNLLDFVQYSTSA